MKGIFIRFGVFIFRFYNIDFDGKEVLWFACDSEEPIRPHAVIGATRFVGELFSIYRNVLGHTDL